MTHTTPAEREISAQRVRPPTSISAQAQAAIATGSPMAAILLAEAEPDPADKDGWRYFLAKREAGVEPFMAQVAEHNPCQVKTHRRDHFTLYHLIPSAADLADEAPVVLYLHGGGYTSGGGVNAARLAMPFAYRLGLQTWSPDYRLPPDHPFPAAIDDAVSAYEFLVDQYGPRRTIVAGRSAGGGLAAATVLKARDDGLPLPLACILQTPEADLTEAGDTIRLNDGIDNYLRPIPNANALYANGHDLRDPHISPLYGNYDDGFPPTILTSGTRDLFLSNTVLLHRALRRAGIWADLHVWEAMGHGGFFETAPEDQQVWDELGRFVNTVVHSLRNGIATERSG